jgi:TonB family protein
MRHLALKRPITQFAAWALIALCLGACSAAPETASSQEAVVGDHYLEQVRQWVARFREYPKAALARQEAGTVMVAFKFARDGTVLDAWIEKSSTYPRLDNAALKMIHDASPIPKPPDTAKGETLVIAIPTYFRVYQR